jgi:hypothetical protein
MYETNLGVNETILPHALPANENIYLLTTIENMYLGTFTIYKKINFYQMVPINIKRFCVLLNFQKKKQIGMLFFLHLLVWFINLTSMISLASLASFSFLAISITSYDGGKSYSVIFPNEIALVKSLVITLDEMASMFIRGDGLAFFHNLRHLSLSTKR